MMVNAIFYSLVGQFAHEIQVFMDLPAVQSRRHQLFSVLLTPVVGCTSAPVRAEGLSRPMSWDATDFDTTSYAIEDESSRRCGLQLEGRHLKTTTTKDRSSLLPRNAGGRTTSRITTRGM
jgi:hypothetical protein